jgi:hypothetical protein
MLRLVYLVRTAPVRIDGYRVDEEVALAGASMEATDKCIVDTDLRASPTVVWMPRCASPWDAVAWVSAF